MGAAPPDGLGDFDLDGDVDLADLDRYNGNIDAAAEGDLEALDLDGDGVVGANDFEQHYETLVTDIQRNREELSPATRTSMEPLMFWAMHLSWLLILTIGSNQLGPRGF